MTSLISYGMLGSFGMMVLSDVSHRLMSSSQLVSGGSSMLFRGMNENSSRIISKHSSSSEHAKWAHPDLELWVMAPPSSSLDTTSWVTVFITSGPVMNM